MSTDFKHVAGHAECLEAGEHICQEPSGMMCDAPGCSRPGGTWWGPYWCPDCDSARFKRLSEQFDRLKESLSETYTEAAIEAGFDDYVAAHDWEGVDWICDHLGKALLIEAFPEAFRKEA